MKNTKPKPFYAWCAFDYGSKYTHDVYHSYIEAQAAKKRMPGINIIKVRCAPVGKIEEGKW